VPVLWRYGVLGMCLLIVGTYALALIYELHQVTRVTKTSMADIVTRLAVLMGGTYALMYGAYLGLERLGLTRTIPQLVAGSVVTGAAYVGIIALVDREAVRDLKSLRRPRLAPTAASS
jgi:porphobilinogen deaminase